MTRDDILRIAHEVDIEHREEKEELNSPYCDGVFLEDMERFVDIVVATERQRFAQECIDLVAFYGGPVELEAAIRALNT